MAHLVLVSEAKAEVEGEVEAEAEARLPEWDLEQGPEEQRPLLGGEASCTRSQLQEFSTNHSLIPDASLPAQVRRVQSVKHEDLNSLFFSGGVSFLPSYLPSPLVCVLVVQIQAYQLLLTFSAVYVKLLVSQRLSGPSHHRLRPLRNHCSSAPFCLCQYINRKILH